MGQGKDPHIRCEIQSGNIVKDNGFVESLEATFCGKDGRVISA